MADLAVDDPDQAADVGVEIGGELKKIAEKKMKEAKGHIENVVSPRLLNHDNGRCIAIFSILAQMVIFICMMVYFMQLGGCAVTFSMFDGDWDDDIAYDPYFEYNMKMCSTQSWILSSYAPDAFGVWDDTSYYDDTVFKDWAPDADDRDLIHGYWADCHIPGYTCDDYYKGQPCREYHCDDTKPCFGQVSTQYAVCMPFAEAIPLATGYLVYANVAIVTLCLSCFCLIKTCKGERGAAMKEAKYQIVGVIARSPAEPDGDKGEVEMS